MQLPSLFSFVLYFVTLLGFWALALKMYVKITPYAEFVLVREGNVSAALSLSGTAIGLALPLASLAIHAVSIFDLALWAAIALGTQLSLWFALRRFVMPDLKEAIEADRRAHAIVLSSLSMALGILNAACLSY